MAASAADKPACPQGASCSITNLLHFADFVHEETGSCSRPSLKRKDTLPVDSEQQQQQQQQPAAKRSRSSEQPEPGAAVMRRGLSLVKQFSSMTREQQKSLVAEALAAKLSLQRRLLQAEAACGSSHSLRLSAVPCLPAEKLALAEGRELLISLDSGRSFRPDSPEEIHFRIAESQFYRLLSQDYVSCYRVTKVEYVVNPRLLREFRELERQLAELGDECRQQILAFHGTAEANIAAICSRGFLAPGDAEFCAATDTGWYGSGVYFSEYPAYAMQYIRGASRLLLCRVQLGRSHACDSVQHGQPCRPGHHSHSSPDGREVAIFSSRQALPCYVVHFRQTEPPPPPDAGAEMPTPTPTPTPTPAERLQRLFCRVSGLSSELLAGSCLLVPQPSAAGGLLLTRDQLQRLCVAHGARVVDSRQEADFQLLPLLAGAGAGDCRDAGGDDGPPVLGLSELCRRILRHCGSCQQDADDQEENEEDPRSSVS